MHDIHIDLQKLPCNQKMKWDATTFLLPAKIRCESFSISFFNFIRFFFSLPVLDLTISTYYICFSQLQHFNCHRSWSHTFNPTLIKFKYCHDKTPHRPVAFVSHKRNENRCKTQLFYISNWNIQYFWNWFRENLFDYARFFFCEYNVTSAVILFLFNLPKWFRAIRIHAKTES